ncbi:MAG: alcohol dehydrogenase catalytic domain-containing protein [Bryobacteraceae bacterium]|nr:alcohol dehydrogenase catalytic domain-containing protein [Bryobacteraceae bacterium]
MRVAQLVSQRRFQLTDESQQDPGPGEVQARVLFVGACGSDLHNFSEGSVGDMPAQYPMVLGHEPSGQIVKTGPGVTGWSPGDKVLLEPAVYCYHCEFCLSGHHNVCRNLRFLSQPGDPGFFRDYVNLPAYNVFPLPDNLSLEEGTLFEPLAIILHSMKFASILLGDSVAVFGVGPIGLLTVAAAKQAGAGRIYAVDPVAARRDLALALGADAAIDPGSSEPRQAVLSETKGRGVDVSIDCVTRGTSLNDCLHVTRNAGRVVVTGIPSEAVVTLDYHVMRRKELGFFNVRRSNHESDAAIQLLREKPELFRPMLTHTFPMERIQPGFELLEAYADGVGKLLVAL